MIRKNKILFGLLLFFTISVMLTACSSNPLDQQRSNGYVITVTYDDNGGAFFDNKEDTLLVDMFNPSQYKKDADGTVRIKLLDPTSEKRRSGGASRIFVAKQNSSLVGWYKTRTPVEVDGFVVDENGRKLTADEDGTYFYLEDDGKKITAVPQYTYSDRWDFDNDFIVYKEKDKEINLTLYAGWVPYYEFNYYYLDGDNWVKLDQVTTFGYPEIHAEGARSYDRDTIWLPEWKNGAMDYSHRYADETTYNFPKISGKTFNSAYTDESLSPESKIEGSFKHGGTLDEEHAEAKNRIQNLYLTYDEGERFFISSASQLIDYADTNGYYQIENDLDFSGLRWPGIFMSETFNGKIFAKDGTSVVFKNIDAEFIGGGAEYGGLFGRIGENAEITDVEFKDVTFTVRTASMIDDVYYGTLAGYIDENADLKNVKVSGKVTLAIGYTQFGSDYDLNLLANGDVSKVDAESVEYELKLIGFESYGGYLYYVEAEEVKVEGLNVTLAFYADIDRELEKSEYVINF